MRGSFKYLFLVTLIGLSLCFGCSRNKPQQKPAPPPTVIGVSIASQDKALNEQLKKSMQENAKKDNIKIVWQESQPEKQEDDISKLLEEQKPKALVVQFADDNIAQAITKKVKEKDVPLLALGTMPQNVPLDGFVGLDAYRTGQQQASFIGTALQNAKPARVMVVKAVGDSTEEVITQGNLEGLKVAGGFQVLVKEVLPGESVSAVVAGDETLNETKGIIVHNPAWTEEIVSLLQDLDMGQRIVTVGVGATKRNAEAIVAGAHEAEIDLDPDLLGKFAYTAAKELAQQEQWQFEKQVTSGAYDVPVKYTPANVISQENIFMLETRYKDLAKASGGEQNQQQGSEGGGSGNSEGQGGSEGSGGSGEKQNKSKVLIQTKEGKTMEIEVEGEVLKVEIQGGEGEKDGNQQQEGGQGSEGGS